MSQRWMSVLLASAVLALAVVTAPLLAQKVEDHPGYFDIDGLGVMDLEDVSVDINLRGALLRMVGAAVLSSEPELSELVRDLLAMRVVVAPVPSAGREELRGSLRRAAAELERLQWQRVVRVKEDDEEVYLYVREDQEEIVGLTIFVLDAEERTLINMVGKIDFSLLGEIGSAFDIPSIEEALRDQPETEEGRGDD